MKTKLKSIIAIALCAVGLSAFAEEPAGSEGNPWLVGTPNEADVKAWTNGTGKLTIEGTGAMMDFEEEGSAPWDSVKDTIIIAEIGSGVTNIGKNAFSGCAALTSVTIPSGVTNIGESAFHDCSGLSSVTIPSSVTSIDIYAFVGCSGLEDVTISSGVMSIGSQAFKSCSGLTSVTIPSSVTNIGSGAFTNCKGLKSVTILSSVASIDTGAFSSCKAIAELKVQSIEDWCKVILKKDSAHPFAASTVSTPKLVAGGKEITELVIPSTITEIRGYTFLKNLGLTSVTIPSGVASIGEYAFRDCSGLSSVTIPSSVTNIGFNAFAGFSEHASVIVMRETPPTIEGATFGNISKFDGTIYVPEGSVDAYKTAEGWDTYATKIFSAYLVSGVAEHGSLSFDKTCFPADSYKEPTETVTVTVTPDEGYLFKSLVWNDGTDHDITEAKSFTMPLACVTVTAVFEKEIPKVPVGENAYMQVVDDGSCLITGTGSVTNFPAGFDRNSISNAVVADGITEIGSRFFKECLNLNTVKFGKDVAKVGEKTFLYCMSLETVEIDNPDFDLSSLDGAINYHTAVNPDGSLYPIPNVTVAGCQQTLEGKAALTDANWTDLGEVVPGKPMEEYAGYHFFRIVLKKIGE